MTLPNSAIKLNARRGFVSLGAALQHGEEVADQPNLGAVRQRRWPRPCGLHRLLYGRINRLRRILGDDGPDQLGDGRVRPCASRHRGDRAAGCDTPSVASR